MERKILQNNWIEMRGRISEWWDDLTDEDLDRIDAIQTGYHGTLGTVRIYKKFGFCGN